MLIYGITPQLALYLASPKTAAYLRPGLPVAGVNLAFLAVSAPVAAAVTASQLSVTANQPQAAVVTGSAIVPAVAAAAVSQPAVVVTAGSAASPATSAASAAQPAATASASSAAAPAAVPGFFSLPAVTASAGSTAAPGATLAAASPAIASSDGASGTAVFLPPCGFAIDGRPENARQYPAGRELATNANANLATEANANLDWARS